MASYLVHIYRRGERAVQQGDSGIIGIVEGVESERRYPFTSPKELWDILAGRNPEIFPAAGTAKEGGVSHDQE